MPISLAERSQKRADTNARRAQGVAFVDFKLCVKLAGALENAGNLFGGNGIKAAPETDKLHKFRVFTFGCKPCSPIQATVEGPLVHDIDHKRGLN